MGFPVYRMVRSEYVLEKVGGRWNQWDADLDVDDRGGIETDHEGKPAESHHRPDRVVVEVRQVQTYSHLDEPGWILERWYPAAFFGSPAAWAENVVAGTNVPLLGPFPSEGRYLKIVGPFPLEPDLSFIEDYIASWEQRRASFPDDVEEHIRNCELAAQEREERRSEGAVQKNFERMRESVAPLSSTSLEAGRWRSRMFERAGQTAHIGN